MLRALLRIALKYKRATLVIALLAITALFAANMPLANNESTEKSKPAVQIPYENVEVGYTTHEDLIRTHGVFSYEYKVDDYIVYAYESNSSRYAPDRFYLKNDVVELKEIYYNPLQRRIKIDNFRQQYGEPEATLFTEGIRDTSNRVDVFAQQGVALYSLNENLVRIQYFRPTSVEGYRSTWGEGLLEKKPTPIEHTPDST